MLNPSLNTYSHLKKLLQAKNLIIQKYLIPKQYSCVCGLYFKPERLNDKKILRLHSTQSDQHRQKAVIETSSPNVIEKLSYDKILPVKHDQLIWRDKIDPYLKLARWDKPIGIYLLFWPCSWSIATGAVVSGVDLSTAVTTAGIFLVGAGLMRGAGCTINDMWDKDIDQQVDRTATRPLVTGAVSTTGAVTFLGAQLTAALAVLLQLNCYSVALGASSMALVITYPLAKRFTNYPQVFLGATFNWGALLGFSAITGSIDPHICLPMYAGALAWTVIYDTIYAHQDKTDDARIGIKSTALTFGPRTKPYLSCALAASGASLLYAGHMAELSHVYTLAVTAYVLSVAQQIYTLDIDNPSDCARKFLSNSYIGFIILLGILGGGYGTYLENRQKNRDIDPSSKAKSCVFG